ncbi:MAG: DUF1972 domain-containing protein [Clostridium sp.]|nr:DUF1972 domain-containing protein [Clostridium sp.]MCM1398485.1 DUF1972 domain-containing protein [Clostridium sp.]MCM1460207.1 DUF1972 domain-containing protein [Bacteroides sp.]
MQHVFIVGSKGIPGNYGGYETFVDRLTEYHQENRHIRYHVACKNMEKREIKYHNARCFSVKVPDIGAAQAVYYDLKALHMCCRYIKRHNIKNPIVYVLACRIGPFCGHYLRKLHRLGGRLFVNPDGHEWERSKWNKPIRCYWKLSERMMVKNSDLLVCDSKQIEKYIKQEYEKYNPQTTFIAYGADMLPETEAASFGQYQAWLKEKQLTPYGYYLIVGRFVPENNFETMLREFMKSDSKRDLAILTTADEGFYKRLQEKLDFESDDRIKFVGTVYEKQLLFDIRRHAYAYLHGHEVGGTNPSLLEALSATDVNLLLGVSFNREVGERAALYWNKSRGNLAALINKAEQFDESKRKEYGVRAKARIKEAYTWEHIAGLYEKLFLGQPKIMGGDKSF